jgi:hypothetical protein
MMHSTACNGALGTAKSVTLSRVGSGEPFPVPATNHACRALQNDHAGANLEHIHADVNGELPRLVSEPLRRWEPDLLQPGRLGLCERATALLNRRRRRGNRRSSLALVCAPRIPRSTAPNTAGPARLHSHLDALAHLFCRRRDRPAHLHRCVRDLEEVPFRPPSVL